MKIGFLSGLASISLLMSCSSGEQEAGNEAPSLDPAAIDPAAAETGYLAQMQGSWASDDNLGVDNLGDNNLGVDAGNSITVTGSRFQSFTDGALQDDVPIIFVDSCKTRIPDLEGKAFVLAGKEKQTCYLFDSVSEDKLSYIESTRGRTSRFTREN